MADDHNRKVGGRVVRAVVVQGLPALRALVDDLQIAVEQAADATGRASEQGAAQECLL